MAKRVKLSNKLSLERWASTVYEAPTEERIVGAVGTAADASRRIHVESWIPSGVGGTTVVHYLSSCRQAICRKLSARAPSGDNRLTGSRGTTIVALLGTWLVPPKNKPKMSSPARFVFLIASTLTCSYS